MAVVRGGVTPAELARDGMSVGILSAGIGEVSAEKTYADISAGNRDRPPSDAVPGLLRMTLARAGLTRSLRTVAVGRGELGGLVAGLRADDLLVAFAAPPPAKNEGLPIGIAGNRFHGSLTSDSTRTAGYVLSTDLAPTILRRLGLPIPGEMNGEPIRAEGRIDPGAIEDLAARMKAIPERRAPVVIGCLATWVLVAALIALLRPGRGAAAAAWLALAFAYMPLMLLAGAALEPAAGVEAALVGFGAAALAALTVALVPGWSALAVACGATLVAYAIDLIAGSDLTVLSLLGPNPIYGARFYGIGNELEALFAVMVPVGVGAGLTAWAGEGRTLGAGAAARTFLAVAVLAAIVFGAGRFGADVGAAIVLPVGAAVAAVSVGASPTLPDLGSIRLQRQRGRIVAALIAAPLIALVFLALIDLVSGANAHLTRSVLDAGGTGDLADLADRRLRLSAHDFGQAAGNPLFWLVIAGLLTALLRRREIALWLEPAPIARAGLIGAAVSVALCVLVNDSGATVLVLGSLALGAFLAFAWAQRARAEEPQFAENAGQNS